MPVTLYKSTSGNTASNGGLGPFKKKCLILAVLETDGRTQATAALGRVVINLAEYAAVEHQETRTFVVTCNKTIHTAVGDPQLMVTIRCRWKKLARESGGGQGGVAGPLDDTASMSTDTTGSRMTVNLSSFLRFKFTGGKVGGPLNEEQDLRGFEGTGGGAPRSSTPGDALGMNKVMDTIQESHDEPSEPSPMPLRTPGGSRSLTPQTSVKALTPTSSILGGAEPSPPPLDPSRAQSSPLEAGALGGIGMSLREMHAARQKGQASATAVSPPSLLRVGESGLRSEVASPSASGPPSRGGFGTRPATGDGDRSYGACRTSSATSQGLGAGVAAALESADLFAAMRHELLCAAAMEASVYLARRQRPATAPQQPHSLAHAPARRVARTVLCLGPGDGPTFGAAALRALRAQVAGASDGLEPLSYWWSNAVHLRALLAGLSLAAAANGMLGPPGSSAASASSAAGGGGIGTAGGGGEHWAAAALVPELRRLERAAFEAVVGSLWGRLLLPAVQGRGSAPRAAAPTKRALQEAAIKRWFEGLDAVASALATLGSGSSSAAAGGGGHVALLRSEALLQLLRRCDLLLFYHLLGGSEQPAAVQLLSDYDPSGEVLGPPAALPALDEASLPFSRGTLTFGGGMSVKMTVTRLQQWAAGQALLSAGGADGGGGGAAHGPLFPLLRGSADLLMMPKELLLDRSVRQDVGSALALRSVVAILEGFQPDEFASELPSPAILDCLREDAALPHMGLRGPGPAAGPGYCPPSEAALLRGVEAGSEPGLEYGQESEDELEEVAQLAARGSIRGGGGGTAGGGGAARFRLLHEAWAGGMPRRRAFSVASEQGL